MWFFLIIALAFVLIVNHNSVFLIVNHSLVFCFFFFNSINFWACLAADVSVHGIEVESYCSLLHLALLNWKIISDWFSTEWLCYAVHSSGRGMCALPCCAMDFLSVPSAELVPVFPRVCGPSSLLPQHEWPVTLFIAALHSSTSGPALWHHRFQTLLLDYIYLCQYRHCFVFMNCLSPSLSMSRVSQLSQFRIVVFLLFMCIALSFILICLFCVILRNKYLSWINWVCCRFFLYRVWEHFSFQGHKIQ